MKKLAIVHGRGSLSALQIVDAVKGMCNIIWVVDPTNLDDTSPIMLLKRLGEVVEIDASEPRDALERLRPFGPSGIIVFADNQLILAAQLACGLGLRFHPPAVAERLVDKVLQRRALSEASILGPKFQPIYLSRGLEDGLSRAREVGYPAVLKPSRGTGSRNTFLVGGEAELRAALEEIQGTGEEELILESLIEGNGTDDETGLADYVSVESVAFDNKVFHLVVTGRFPTEQFFRETGAIVPGGLDPESEREVFETADRAIRALGVRDGCLHTEIKLGPDGPRIIEVNGRVGGGISNLLELASGISLNALAIEISLGKFPTGLETPVACHQVAFRYVLQPPPWAKKLLAIDGAATLEGMKSVKSLEINKEVGAKVDWREGSNGYIVSIVGAVSSVGDLPFACEAINQVLTVSYS